MATPLQKSPFGPASSFDQEKLTSLLRAERLDEARDYLASVIETTVSAENYAAVFVQYSRAYMQVMNAINKRYLDSLQRAQGLIADLHGSSQQNDTARRIADLKAHL